jgi:hypothetical protein
VSFPTDPLGVTVELLLDGVWTSLTDAPVYERTQPVITRGRSDEATRVDRSTFTFDVNNQDGNLSPRNPTGAYYGLIGRNTRCRARLSPASAGYLLMPVELDGAETADSASLSITGDIDIRVDVAFDDWDAYGGLANKYNGTGNQRSWSFLKNADSTLTLRWSTDGGSVNLFTKTSTAAVTVPASGRLALRATLDVDNGAAGNDVKFYTADTVGTGEFLSGDNTDFEGGKGTWGGGANTSTAQTTDQAHGGTGALKLTSTSSGNISARSDSNLAADRFDVTGGAEYEVSEWFRAAASSRTCQVLVNWYNGTTFIQQDASAGVADSTGGWTRIAALFTAPATATRAAIFGLVQSTAAGGEIHYIDDAQVTGPTVWTQLGSTVTTAGTTSIFDSTADLEFGRSNVGTGMVGRLHAFQLCQGIVGTLHADVVISDEEAGSASFADRQELDWTLLGDASIVDPAVRFHGEVSEWPQRWDTGQDVYVPIEASGVLRRLGQGSTALKSTMYRGYTTLANQPKAYWPCEDGQDATSIASALGGPPMTVTGTPNLASNTDFKCSDSLPVMNASQWTGIVPSYTSTGNIQVWILISIPAAGTTDGQSLFSLHTQGTVRKWSLMYGTGGNLRLKGFDSTGTLVEDSGNIAFLLDGNPERISVSLQQNGADVDYEILGQRLDGNLGGLGGTFTTQTLGRATAIVVNPGADDLGDIVFGHVSIHDEVRAPADLIDEFIAYVGETAGRRIQRLCLEEDIAFRAVGDQDATAAMGAQFPGELLTLLQDAADADGGILYEPRDLFGLAYRTRESMYRQDPALTLDYAAGNLSGMDPTDDDQHVRNDITVQREGGSSARAVRESGPLSVLPPPDGVGRYDEQVTLNLEADSQLGDAAGWLLHLGTVDEARYPVLEVNLARPVFTADEALTLACQDLDEGDRATVANPPAWLPPDQITQLAQGMVETFGAVTHMIGINCVPESPWAQVAIYDDGESRYSSDGSTLASAITSTTATSASVATATGPLWSDADGDFDIRVGGEVMTVTAISGTSSPQTFTVTRSVNGVAKTHSTGAEVALDHPRVYVR